MDLKLNDKTWVGNIYQKFEALCQEVDDFVIQDTLKYVESQVETAGQSLKKYCSDAVQDLIHSPSEDSGNIVTETVAQKPNHGIFTSTSSMLSIAEKHVVIDTKQSSIIEDRINPLQICDVRPSTQLSHLKQNMPPPTEDLNELADTFSSGQDDDAYIFENTNTSFDGNDDSDVEESVWKEQSQSEDLSYLDNIIGTSLPSESIDEYDNNEISTKVSSATLLNGVGIGSFPKERDDCCFDESDSHSYISRTPRSSELTCSIVSSGSNVPVTTFISSSSSLSTKSYNLPGCSDANPQETEKTCYPHTGSISSVSDKSSALSSSDFFPDVACDNNGDMRVALSNCPLPFEVTDVETCGIDEAHSVEESSGNKYELQCKHSEVEDLMSSLKTGHADDSNIDMAIPGMETIDLSDEVKLDGSCVIVDSKLLVSFSCRAGRFRSFKKIIQDAFTSRKRLLKEYEQLAILYGDIDMESCHQKPNQNMLPSITNMSLGTENLGDSEWELL